VNRGSDEPWFQVTLLWQAQQYHSGQNSTLGIRGTAMRRKTKKDKYWKIE